jgi:two-component system response regulator ResD
MAKKILLIEDEPFVRDLYSTVLTRAGYELDQAVDGQEALDKLASATTYDLVLLDIMLPKVTGMEILKQMRAEGSKTIDTPVYLLTNLGDENIVKEAYRLGANGYLLKAKYLPKQIVEEVNKFFVKSPQ